MTTFYLLNTTYVGTTKYFAGDLINDAVDPKTAIVAAGGICWPSSDATVASAGALAESNRKNKGIDEAACMAIMLASVTASLTATDVANAATAAAATAVPASATVAGQMSAAQFLQLNSASPVYFARGAVFANVADLTAFVVSQDGVTYVANDIVLLANQTTAAQCGLYKVGAVSGTAPLTRIAALPAAATYVNGCTVQVSEGTIWAGSVWKAMCTGAKVVGTDDPLFYPKNCKGILTLSSGTKTIGATEGLFLWSTTLSVMNCTMNTPGGTLTLSTGGYGANSSTRTAGKSGTGAATVIARVAAGTIDTANNSTVDWLVTNW